MLVKIVESEFEKRAFNIFRKEQPLHKVRTLALDDVYVCERRVGSYFMRFLFYRSSEKSSGILTTFVGSH